MKKKNPQHNDKLLQLEDNSAIAEQYIRYVNVFFKEMKKEYYNQIMDYYRENRSELVLDTDYTSALERIINNIGIRWKAKFGLLADNVSKVIVGEVDTRNKAKFTKIKKKYPWVLTDTRDLQKTVNTIQASIAENVSLIKSIEEKYHSSITSSVMRSVSQGNNLQQLTQDLREIGGISERRIKLIASDQVAKATAQINRQRSIDTGFTKAIWKKSIAGKTHRISHARANGEVFDIAKGCLIDDEYILPRENINCKCSYNLIIPD